MVFRLSELRPEPPPESWAVRWFPRLPVWEHPLGFRPPLGSLQVRPLSRSGLRAWEEGRGRWPRLQPRGSQPEAGASRPVRVVALLRSVQVVFRFLQCVVHVLVFGFGVVGRLSGLSAHFWGLER